MQSRLEEIYASLFLINIKSFLPGGQMKRSLVFLLARNFRGGPRATFSHNGESDEKMPEMHLVSLQCFSRRVESPESKAHYCRLSSPALQKTFM